MREHGWRWSQATVWEVEKGKRPLRLAEASDLADILGTTLDYLARGSEGDTDWHRRAATLHRALEKIRAAVDEAPEWVTP